MSTTPAITAWVPKISADPKPDEIHRLFTLAFQKLGNHATAFGIQQAKINSITSGTSTTVIEGSSGGGGSITPATPGGIPVNNQSGVTSYATASTDDGALIVLSNASPIAVTLTSQSPPWSCFIANQSALGGGTATMTPASGTINGSATLVLLPSYFALVAFDGTNWFAATLPIVPVSFGPISHEFLTEYNSATGAFSAAQPSFTDVSGIAQVAQGGTGTSTPALVAGSNVTITGSWPNQTISSSGIASTLIQVNLSGGALLPGQGEVGNTEVSAPTNSVLIASLYDPTSPGANAFLCPFAYNQNGIVLWSVMNVSLSSVTVLSTTILNIKIV